MLAEVLLPLVIATAAGAVVGLHFELSNRPRGLPTHVLTAVLIHVVYRITDALKRLRDRARDETPAVR